MATLSITQMYALARSAALPPAAAVTAAAVGMAESSGRAAVTSPNPDGGTNVGIWQLDTKGVGAGYTVAQLQDPATNAKVMAKGSRNGTSWGPWQTYGSGAYHAFTGQAQAAQAAEDAAKGQSGGAGGWLSGVLKDIGGAAGSVGSTVAGATGAIGSLLSLPSQLTDFLSSLEQPAQALMWIVNPANWARIVAGMFGFLLLIAGLVTLGMSA